MAAAPPVYGQMDGELLEIKQAEQALNFMVQKGDTAKQLIIRSGCESMVTAINTGVPTGRHEEDYQRLKDLLKKFPNGVQFEFVKGHVKKTDAPCQLQFASLAKMSQREFPETRLAAGADIVAPNTNSTQGSELGAAGAIPEAPNTKPAPTASSQDYSRSAYLAVDMAKADNIATTPPTANDFTRSTYMAPDIAKAESVAPNTNSTQASELGASVQIAAGAIPEAPNTNPVPIASSQDYSRSAYLAVDMAKAENISTTPPTANDFTRSTYLVPDIAKAENIGQNTNSTQASELGAFTQVTTGAIPEAPNTNLAPTTGLDGSNQDMARSTYLAVDMAKGENIAATPPGERDYTRSTYLAPDIARAENIEANSADKVATLNDRSMYAAPTEEGAARSCYLNVPGQLPAGVALVPAFGEAAPMAVDTPAVPTAEEPAVDPTQAMTVVQKPATPPPGQKHAVPGAANQSDYFATPPVAAVTESKREFPSNEPDDSCQPLPPDVPVQMKKSARSQVSQKSRKSKKSKKSQKSQKSQKTRKPVAAADPTNESKKCTKHAEADASRKSQKSKKTAPAAAAVDRSNKSTKGRKKDNDQSKRNQKSNKSQKGSAGTVDRSAKSNKSKPSGPAKSVKQMKQERKEAKKKSKQAAKAAKKAEKSRKKAEKASKKSRL